MLNTRAYLFIYLTTDLTSRQQRHNEVSEVYSNVKWFSGYQNNEAELLNLFKYLLQ